MPLVAKELADKLKTGLEQSLPATAQTEGLADAIVAEITQSAKVLFAPGTVTGTAPPSGGPLIAGAASGGTITGIVGATLAQRIVTGIKQPNPTAQIQGMADAIATHLMTGVVSFATGSITGTCSNTPTSPGVLVGAGANGTISGLDGTVLANLMAPSIGQPSATPQLTKFCTELVNYIQQKAVVNVAMGLVTATCSAGGGPIIAGAVIPPGGTIV